MIGNVYLRNVIMLTGRQGTVRGTVLNAKRVKRTDTTVNIDRTKKKARTFESLFILNPVLKNELKA